MLVSGWKGVCGRSARGTVEHGFNTYHPGGKFNTPPRRINGVDDFSQPFRGGGTGEPNAIDGFGKKSSRHFHVEVSLSVCTLPFVGKPSLDTRPGDGGGYLACYSVWTLCFCVNGAEDSSSNSSRWCSNNSGHLGAPSVGRTGYMGLTVRSSIAGHRVWVSRRAAQDIKKASPDIDGIYLN